MQNKKSDRNKTIDISVEEGVLYLERCVKIDSIQENLSLIKNKTIIGNSLAIFPLLPENSIDLLIVDPPYNLSKEYHGTGFNKMKASDYELFTEAWLDLSLPLLKETGSIYVCCDWESSLIIGKILALKAKIRNRITWQREKGRGAKANWKNGMEDIWFATKGMEYTFNLDDVKIRRKVIAPYREAGKPKDWEETQEGNYRDTSPSNFWDDITIPFWSMPENTAHPTQKSEKLLAKIILASSNEGDVVLDPFLGSGTTSVVAKKLGRNYIGIEQNPLYCTWSEYRIERAEADKRIQGFNDGVFWERNSLNGQKPPSATCNTKQKQLKFQL